MPPFRGARKGRTEDIFPSVSSALHRTVCAGHAVRSHGGHLGQTVGAGHFTSGQRGRGQAGHSPHCPLHALLSTMIGCDLGMLDLSTYWLRSGTGGHSVFSIYWLMSGSAGHGGMLDFRTYLLISG